ncbi:MAG: RidA family protein [Oscillospiraceae bacterium]|jgi:enamine deaminase RidA (YjgF/YER057c/UK114 family)|nr:RidA family protein [Oscillospiraceae bacterium]
MDVYQKLNELGLTLPAPPAKGGMYAPAKRFANNLYYISGCGPVLDAPIKGKLGKEFTTEQGKIYARNCMLNVLAVLEAAIGDLRKVKSAVKILVFVAGTDSFDEQPQVANGASQLLADLFGEPGIPSRSAIGVNALPGNIPVEIEGLFEVDINAAV